MVVNDLVVQGAEPIVFLDYVAMSRLDRTRARSALRGMAEGCRRAGCALLGGETATMPASTPKARSSWSGSASAWSSATVSSTDPRSARAMRSSASRRRLSQQRLQPRAQHRRAGRALGRDRPARRECRAQLDARERAARADAHLRAHDPEPDARLHAERDRPHHGRRLPGQRAARLPKGVQARIDPTLWPRPPIFGWLQRRGGIAEDEMLRVFNCGIGMVLIVPSEQANDVIDRVHALGERAYRIGVIDSALARRAAAAPGPARGLMRGFPSIASSETYRVRRWDVLMLGSALPGLIAAVRLGQRGLRVLVLEERAAESDDFAREPFLLVDAESHGVLAECLRAMGIALIDQRRFVGEDVALQVCDAERRVDLGRTSHTADEWASWGLASRDDARRFAAALDEAAEAERASLLAAPPLLRPARRAREALAPVRRQGPERGWPSALAQAPPALRSLLDAPVRSLSNLGSKSPSPERARG
jgi:phosphoribosylformylglycinamidine cyclo-ligase